MEVRDDGIYVAFPEETPRIRTVSELNAEIDGKFGEAGIEIAFPQLDVNLSGPVPPTS